MKTNNLILIGLLIGFFLLGYNALEESKPEYKDKRIYSELKNYMPYFLEKRFGGYSIVSKITKEKEKPPATEVFKRLEQLEKMWGKEFLKISDNSLIIVDKNGTQVGKIEFHLQSEKKWVKSYFGI